MLREPETPHNSFPSFDSWHRNSPTSFFFQPLWGHLPVICLSALCWIPDLFLTLLWMTWVVTLCQPCFEAPLQAALGVGSTGDWRAVGRESQCISPLWPRASGTVFAPLPGPPSMWPSSHGDDPHGSCFHWRPSSPACSSHPSAGSSFPLLQF